MPPLSLLLVILVHVTKTYHTCKFSSAGGCFWICVATFQAWNVYFSTSAYYVTSNVFKYTTTPSPRILLCALSLNLTLRQKSIVLEPWLLAVNLVLHTNDLYTKQFIHCKLVIPRPAGGLTEVTTTYWERVSRAWHWANRVVWRQTRYEPAPPHPHHHLHYIPFGIKHLHSG
jgi:uncharacterized membrane protein YgdD (TMEM256/DUF423 family)